MGTTHLEENQEVVQLLLLRPTVEAHPAGIKKDTNKSDAEEIVWHIHSRKLMWQRPSVRWGGG